MACESSNSTQKRTIQQLPIPSRKNHNAILHSTYATDIVDALGTWNCKRAVLVHSKALDGSTHVVKDLKERLGSLLVASKSGVGAHSPYTDVIDITQLLHGNHADCLISIGSSSYSDACKIARLLHPTLPRDQLSISSIEALVDQDKGIATDLKDPKVKLILVPTSLSASEWSHISSATNPQTHKKQHFGLASGASVAATSPQKLWLSSGMRAVDHCVETMTHPSCTPEAEAHMQEALTTLLAGLSEYKAGEAGRDREELLKGIAECQLGSRQAMMGILMHRIPMGASHAIGHQLGSVMGVMHGVTSCVMLAPVLGNMAAKGLQGESQMKVLKIFNETLGWQEKTAAAAVSRFVRSLEMPGSLVEVGVVEQQDLDLVAERTMTDVWGGGERQVQSKEELLEILESARKKWQERNVGAALQISSSWGFIPIRDV
ncbi:Dehydroquinate synthase-like protein [Lophiostoma macrostomum CBS 122681]|uniref:Dehydroquinate synthase-like protein n=1 Tax=Lophiostoma macrostomum CBS 122681 TaxID=1314788 RepID=A0A6A6TKA7_9PLEO|nr:Dehydroquinate synthase-like protein [Lophiostoma macrostomum CBS 122681]